MKLKYFKIHSHHYVQLRLPLQNVKHVGIVRRIVKNLRKVFQKPSLFRRKLLSLEFRRGFFLFFALCSLAVGTIYAGRIVSEALELKSAISGQAETGLAHLTSAQKALAEQNLDGAQQQFSLALESFSQSKQNLGGQNQILNSLLSAIPQTKDAQSILDSAGLISQAGTNFTQFYALAAQLKLSPEGLSDRQNLQDMTDKMAGLLNLGGEQLGSANQKLQAVNVDNLPGDKRQEFIDLKSKLQMASTAAQTFKGVFSLFTALVVPRQNVLVLFENNNELRASGGFPGTYGNFVLENGKINNLNVSSIYDLDGQLADQIEPPTPILNVNDRWFLRDSNWFADFPASARKISDFYEKEGGETPDLVMVLTPSLFVNLLKVTGPISMPQYNVTLTADNFVEQIQALSTISYNQPLNKPKQILADFFPAFLQHLSSLPSSAYPGVLGAIENALSDKQMSAYSRDEKTEQMLEQYNWGGSIQSTDRDYLSIISSNLGGTKTDLSLQKTISLKTTINTDGRITDNLTLTVHNPLPYQDDFQNTSFVRFLVPSGSKLVSADGFDTKNLDAAKNPSYKTDSDAAAWEQGALVDVGSGTMIGQESGKTYFGNWLVVPGGESRTVHISYTVPFNIDKLDRFSLLLQKQLGSTDDQFNYSVGFPGRNLEWENFNPENLETGNVSVSATIDSDKFYGFVFQNN